MLFICHCDTLASIAPPLGGTHRRSVDFAVSLR
jgi:hypothetical protein